MYTSDMENTKQPTEGLLIDTHTLIVIMMMMMMIRSYLNGVIVIVMWVLLHTCVWCVIVVGEMFQLDSSHLHTLTRFILRHCVSHTPLSAAVNKMASCSWYRHWAAANKLFKKINKEYSFNFKLNFNVVM